MFNIEQKMSNESSGIDKTIRVQMKASKDTL